MISAGSSPSTWCAEAAREERFLVDPIELVPCLSITSEYKRPLGYQTRTEGLNPLTTLQSSKLKSVTRHILDALRHKRTCTKTNSAYDKAGACNSNEAAPGVLSPVPRTSRPPTARASLNRGSYVEYSYNRRIRFSTNANLHFGFLALLPLRFGIVFLGDFRRRSRRTDSAFSA